MTSDGKVCILSGGVGGAKLVLGMSEILDPKEFIVVANTGDDFVHLGLHISPDIDTLVYTLAGMVDEKRGWGLKEESWNFLGAVGDLGGETWFNLGDKDLAMHVERTKELKAGVSLSQVTKKLSAALGVKIDIVPMADSSVATTILTDDGPLAFQHYFVRDKCNPKVKGFKFEGLDKARPADGINRFNAERQRALLIAPSNPFVSIDPILGIPKLRETFIGSCQVKLAVSPIVGGIAIKGPAAKMMSELGIPSTATEVARHYLGLIDGIVIDEVDRDQASQIESLGIKPFVTKTIMSTLDDKIGLATDCIEYIDYLAGK
tara:strand:- start:317 stop:1273 length:957 start_codon:yes stop_codon:yes gene_type:complete